MLGTEMAMIRSGRLTFEPRFLRTPAPASLLARLRALGGPSRRRGDGGPNLSSARVAYGGGGHREDIAGGVGSDASLALALSARTCIGGGLPGPMFPKRYWQTSREPVTGVLRNLGSKVSRPLRVSFFPCRSPGLLVADGSLPGAREPSSIP